MGRVGFLFWCGTLIALAACDGGGSSSGGSADGGVQEVLVQASEARDISFGDGAILSLSATSLDSQQALRFEVVGEDGELLYRLGPVSLSVLTPARLTLPLLSGGSGRWVIARQEGEAWRPLLSSVQGSESVSASITEFGHYRLIPQPQLNAVRNIGPVCDESASEQDLRIVHVADLHARYGSPEKLFGRIKAYHRQALSDTPYTLFTNGGDDFEKGSVAEMVSEGAATVAAIQAMEFDVRVVGNHDFAWGADTLLQHAEDERAAVIASNSHYQGDAQPFAARDIVAIQLGCLKVGLFGMSSVPWNELDEPLESLPIPDFVPGIRMNWHWQQIAEGAISQYRDQVDVLIMLSHLGVGADRELLEQYPEIDMALGGHTHGGTAFELLDGGNILLQPDFYADGLSDLVLSYSLPEKQRLSATVNHVPSRDISDIDPAVDTAVEALMAQYAPDAYAEIALVSAYADATAVSEIAARAARYHHGADAALLDPALVVQAWLPGSVTQTDFHRAYPVERQVSDTPGFNAFYRVQVSAAEFAAMRAAQPTWVVDAADLDEKVTVSVILQKGAALNMPRFFSNVAQAEASFLSEAWESLDSYARYRTSECLYMDRDLVLHACTEDTLTTTWQFFDDDDPLRADSGPSSLNFYQQGGDDTVFALASALGLPALPGGDSVVMAFPGYAPDEGLLVTAAVPPNAQFGARAKLGEYSLVMDLLWPAASDGRWRAVLQTALDNSDDADLFFQNAEAGGIGIASGNSGYFGRIPAEQWHRVAVVFYADETNGTFKVYIDGEQIGAKAAGDIGERWAIDEQLLLLTDNGYETEAGYVNALLFSGRALSDRELQRLGGPKQQLQLTLPTEQLQQRVQRALRF